MINTLSEVHSVLNDNILPFLGEHRTTKSDNTVNTNWTTHNNYLTITQPENNDGCRKIVTNIAPRPSDSEISNEEAVSKYI